MGLRSNLLRSDSSLEACLISDPAHIIPGSTGEHVSKIQIALALVDQAAIDSQEASHGLFGPTTKAAVLNFKRRRNIINWTYQTQVDDIVGRMTIRALDAELTIKENGLTRLEWI